MLEDTKTHFDIKTRECKDLCKELKALKQAFDELNASHKRLECNTLKFWILKKIGKYDFIQFCDHANLE
jgi:hypothetical protein